MLCFPVVDKREGCGVAFVPVVGVAGFWLVAGVALLGLVCLTPQLDFYRITFFAEFSHAVDKSGSEWGCGIRDILPALEWDNDTYVSLQDFFLRIVFGGDEL